MASAIWLSTKKEKVGTVYKKNELTATITTIKEMNMAIFSLLSYRMVFAEKESVIREVRGRRRKEKSEEKKRRKM